MSRSGEAYMPAAMVLRVLQAAGEHEVLVGGQALAFWMDRYDIHQPGELPAVSRDVDFFTPDAANMEPLRRFARAIHGQSRILPMSAISALIGSAIAPAGDDGIYNVDLLHAVVGLTREELQRNAVRVHVEGVGHPVRVMHPLHVLQSRNANLHQLVEKQDDLGKLQFRLAIDVARRFLELEVDRVEADVAGGGKEREILDVMRPVIDYASEAAARKNAERHGIHLADALPAWRIHAPAFWKGQWPHLRQRMSPAYAAACEDRRRA